MNIKVDDSQVDSERESKVPYRLSGILYFLHSTPDIYTASIYYIFESGLKDLYSSSELTELKGAIDWANGNPRFDFKSYADVRQDNEQIKFFLKEIGSTIDRILMDANDQKYNREFR